MRDWAAVTDSTATRSVVPATASGYTIHFSPVYELSGNADSADVRAMISEHDAELLNQLRVMLEEEEEDRVRRRM